MAMADEAAFVEEGISPAQSPLVTVSFQRDVNRKQKYLEAEPKALGITQIGLSVFQIATGTVFLAKNLSPIQTEITFFISSLLVIIAGSVAVAAQNLHLPTLRACLGMQIVACGASIVNAIGTLVRLDEISFSCYRYHDYVNNTLEETCQGIVSTHSHLYAECVLIHTTLVAISATLAAYCCKVINCCGPASKMPVITVQAPPVQE